MRPPAEFWVSLLPKGYGLAEASNRRHDYCLKVLTLLAERHPDIYAGKKGATLSAREAQNLVDTFKKDTPGHIFKHRVSYLIRGLEHGVMELNWNVAIPSPPVVIPRERPRFTHEKFAELPETYAIEKAFLENLEQPAPDTYTTRIGQLLLSAVLFGGLIHKRWFTPWVEALSEPRHARSVLWLDLRLTPEHLERERRSSGNTGKVKPDHSPNKATWEINKRWFADPMTHTLISRWLRHFPADLTAGRYVSPLLAIRQYLAWIMPESTTVTEPYVVSFLNGSATRLGLKVAPFLASFAEGKNKSVSLGSQAWERLLTGKIRAEQEPSTDQMLGPVIEPIAVPSPHQVVDMAKQEKLLKEVLRKILPADARRKRKSSEAREELRVFYEAHREKICQALACLTLWGIDLLTHYARHELIRGRAKSCLRASSVRNYFEIIGKRLISVTGNIEILDLDGDELHDLYRDVIDTCPTQKVKQSVGDRLAGFHAFLSSRFGVPSVDFSDLAFCADPAEQAVDANLLSPASFDDLKKALCSEFDKVSRTRKMQVFIAILGFRCGLRRREALKLRIIDLQGEAEPEILIRNNRYAYVKSASSIRRIPLASLLAEDELALLHDWRRKRTIEDGKTFPESLLFCQEGQPSTQLAESEVFPAIEQAMRQVTGDRGVRFHHLRHSFTTWLLLRLVKDFTPETRHRYHFLEHPQFEPEICRNLRKSLLRNHYLGRQALFVVAQLSGHASPEVTLLHYIHLCDWLLSVELNAAENQPCLSSSTIKNITGIPDHILYYARAGNTSEKRWHLCDFLDRLHFPKKQETVSVLKNPDIRCIPEKAASQRDSATPLWRRVEMVLRERDVGKLPYKELAQRSGFTEEEIRVWCENRGRLSALKTKRGNPRHVNGATLRNNPNFQFPLPLHLQVDREMAGKVLAGLENCRGMRGKLMHEVVRHFIDNYSAAESGVLCRADREISDYVRFLRFLAIPDEQIRVVLVLPSDDAKRRTATAEQKRHAEKLKLPLECITVRNLYSGEYSRKGEQFLQVMNPPIGEKKQIKASCGFRFAMYFFAIIKNLVAEGS